MATPLINTANKYARDVVAGKVPAGKYVRLAAKRHLDDLQASKAKTYPYYFDADAGERACAFIELLPHSKGKWARDGQRLILAPWQCFIVGVLFGWKRRKNDMRRFRELYAEIPRKNGKALAIDTPIATAEGWKNHGDLVPGDRVFSPSGELVEVLAVTPHYDGPCYEVAIGDARIIAHECHEWATERTWYTKRPQGFRDGRALPLVETREIRDTLRGGARGDFVHRIPVANALQLPEAELTIAPYALGAWLGDGTSKAASITFADDEIRERLIANGVPCRAYSTRGKATFYALSDGDRSQAARDKGIASRLRAMGLLGNKRIPIAYLRSSVEQRRELLRGLIDTDGHITTRGQVEIVSIHRGLANDITALVRSLGMKACINEDRAMLNGVDCGPRYRVHFFPRDAAPLAYVQRKRDRQRVLGTAKRRSLARTVTAVESVGERTVNCIQVAGGMYLAGEQLVPTHNSQLGAGIGLYMFIADGEYGAEIYSGATTEKQAWEVFGPAKQMMDRTPGLKRAAGVEVWAKSLAIPSDGSKFEPVIGKPGDGSSPSCALVDEFHEHDTPDLIDTMQTGMGAREQPLTAIITTAGYNLGGPCYDKHLEVKRMLDGLIENDELFGVIFSIDLEDGDDWASPAALQKANPNFGVSVDADYLLSQQRRATINPIEQNRFKTKHLNVWCSARNAWMNMQQWQLCADPHLTIDEFAGEPCYLVLDLASKNDICAFVAVFARVIAGQTHYYAFGRYYLPEDAIEEARTNQALYRKWIAQGHLIETEGAEIDFDLIREDVKPFATRFAVQEIAYDPWRATQLAHQLMKDGATVVEYRQTVQNMSPPMKEVMAAVKSGRFHHDDNPVLNWMIANVVAKEDAKENIYPRKDKPEQKIDGPVALIMGVGRVMASETAYTTLPGNYSLTVL